MKRSLQIPVLVLGGGVGGVAAALTLAEQGVRCIITEPTHWLGGQLTSQAVPPDENKWIEGADGVASATKSYRRFRRLIREHYKSRTHLTDAAMNAPHLNPGGGWVSRLCFDPSIGHLVIQDMLAPYITSGMIITLMRHEPIDAETDGDAVTSVTLHNLDSDEQQVIEPKLILEATETGELYPLAEVEHRIGAEHRDDFGELHGRTDHADPMDQQAITWCFAMEHRPGEEHVIDKPKAYNYWRRYTPKLDIPWPGPLLSWDICGDGHQPRTLAMTPWPDEPIDNGWELWRYRRIVDRSICKNTDAAPPDVSLFNCVQMDYFQKPLLGVSETEKKTALRESREQSLCFFYWMQTEAPRHDGKGIGYPGLKLRGDELGTDDGFAIAPYIREPRRLIAQTILTEAHVGQEQRLAAGIKQINADAPVAGEPFPDSVGIGHYPIDLHPSTAMRSSLYIPASPFRIPLGSLLPVRTRNVIAAGKAMGVTHIANGCTRLHPVEWSVGEAAGMLASMCVKQSVEPAAVQENPKRVKDLQRQLADHGSPLIWPWEKA